jgi:transposase
VAYPVVLTVLTAVQLAAPQRDGPLALALVFAPWLFLPLLALLPHAVLLLDRAGWHTTSNLAVPENMTLIFLPSRAPELNPVENIWQYLRANWLSNQVFATYEAIIEAACEARRKLTDQPQTITSIGLRDWAHAGQS